MYMFAWGEGFMHMCASACRDQRLEVGIFLYCPSPSLLRPGFSLNPNLVDLARLAG